jgi:hypothetical protein
VADRGLREGMLMRLMRADRPGRFGNSGRWRQAAAPRPEAAQAWPCDRR